jgi:hypothetical protein
MLFHSPRRTPRTSPASSRRHAPPRLLESLEPRTLLTAALTNDALAGAWSFNGMGFSGSMSFDNVGNITASSLTDTTGAASTPTGNYTLDTATGALSLIFAGHTYAGSINSSADTIAVTLPGTTATLAVLAKSNAVAFTNADLKGTWSVLLNGNIANSTGTGTMFFDGIGHILGGPFKDAAGKGLLIAGTYSVSAAGVVTGSFAFVDPAGHGTTAFTGQLNTSKDILSVNPTPFAAANAVHAPIMGLIVRTAAKTTADDIAGVWNISRDGLSGSITVADNGKITAGSITDASGNVNTVTGSLTVSSSKVLKLSLKLTHGTTTTSITETGVINDNRNVIALEQSPSNSVASNSKNSLAILTQSQNRPPRLTSIKTLVNAIAATPFTINYATLLANSNAFDVDNDALGFVIETVSSGTLTVNGNAVVAGTTVVHSGDTLSWTPAAGAKGKIIAFTVRATDGALTTAADIPVAVNTLAQPVVKISLTRDTISEVASGPKNVTTYRFSRTGGDLSVPLVVSYTIAGTSPNDGTAFTANPALSGAITIPINKKFIDVIIAPKDDAIANPDGKRTLILTLSASLNTTVGNSYTLSSKDADKSRTLTFLDHNLAPVLAPSGPVAGALKNTPFDISYANLTTDTGASDREHETLTFNVKAIAGTIQKNGVAIPANTFTTIAAGDTLTWIPPTDQSGVISALFVSVSDPFATSAPRALQIIIE